MVTAGLRPVADPRGFRVAFWAAVAITLAVHLMPFADVVGRPLVWLSVLVHELGHGVGGMLGGGDFRELVLYDRDGAVSGVAMVATSSTAASALCTLAGLVGPSVAAALGFTAARSSRAARLALLAIAAFLVWALAFKVRTWLGVGVVGGLVVVTSVAALLASPRGAQLVLMFLSIQLALSLWGHLDYMFSASALLPGGPVPSDTARLAADLGGTFWMWGILSATLSLGALALGAAVLLRRPRA